MASTPNSMVVKGIIFDFHALAPVLPIMIEGLTFVQRKYGGRPLPPDEIQANVGTPINDIVARIVAQSHVREATALYYHFYRKFVSSMLKPYPGAAELVRRVSGRGWRVAVIAGAEKLFAELNISALGLNGHLTAVITSDDLADSDQGVISLAIDRLQTRPDETMFLGRAPAGIEAARRAGLVVGAALWGHSHQREVLLSLKPDHIFNSTKDLEKMLLFQDRLNGYGSARLLSHSPRTVV